MTNEIKSSIISSKMQAMQNYLHYLKNSYLPELKEQGTSQQSEIEKEKNRIEKFKIDIQHYNKHKRFNLLDISKHEQANYIRMYAIEQRQKARDFSQNTFIVVSSLRKCIAAIQILKTMYPQLEIYSNHWLSLPKPIIL